MAIYLVDFENIGYNGLKGIEKLPEGDQVHLFYSSNADKLTFDIHLCINASKARVFYYKVETGAKNALDFQLATYLGSLTAANPDENYFIVSNDDGFHYIIQFWKQRSVDIQQISNLQSRASRKIRFWIFSPPPAKTTRTKSWPASTNSNPNRVLTTPWSNSSATKKAAKSTELSKGC